MYSQPHKPVAQAEVEPPPIQHRRSAVRTLLHREEELVTTSSDNEAEVRHNNKTGGGRTHTKRPYRIHRASRRNSDPSFKNTALISTIRRTTPLESYWCTLLKEKTAMDCKCAVVYSIQCECGEKYVGETGRSLGTRFREHTSLRGTASALGELCHTHRHEIYPQGIKVLAQEDNWWSRTIREAVESF